MLYVRESVMTVFMEKVQMEQDYSPDVEKIQFS